MVVIVGLTDAIKDWTDRPRPPDGLVEASGSSFPSKHAANSTIYTWLAVTVAFRTNPGNHPAQPAGDRRDWRSRR